LRKLMFVAVLIAMVGALVMPSAVLAGPTPPPECGSTVTVAHVPDSDTWTYTVTVPTGSLKEFKLKGLKGVVMTGSTTSDDDCVDTTESGPDHMKWKLESDCTSSMSFTIYVADAEPGTIEYEVKGSGCKDKDEIAGPVPIGCGSTVTVVQDSDTQWTYTVNPTDNLTEFKLKGVKGVVTDWTPKTGDSCVTEATLGNDMKWKLSGCTSPMSFTIYVAEGNVKSGTIKYDIKGKVCNSPCDNCEDKDIEIAGPVPCACPKGAKVSYLKLHYIGGDPIPSSVTAKNGKGVDSTPVSWNPATGVLEIGDSISQIGEDNDCKIYVGTQLNALIHTSCSKPVYPGMSGDYSDNHYFGDFEVWDYGDTFGDGPCAPIPEASTVFLLMAGLAGLMGFFVWRQKRRQGVAVV